jgi:hypothetical protein
LPSAGQQDHAIEVFHFPAFDFAIFAVNVGVGQKLAYCNSTRAPVRLMDDGLWIKAMFNRPPMPNPRNRRSGIDEHTVQVKQQGTAADRNHFI